MLDDDEAGHARGWDPDDRDERFGIRDADFTTESMVLVQVHPPIEGARTFVPCDADAVGGVEALFFVFCDDGTLNDERGPSDGSRLTYVLINP